MTPGDPEHTESDVNRLLASAAGGDSAAFDQVFRIVYDELRQLARQVRRGRGAATVNTTALVHEAYLRLLPSRTFAWEGRSHFMGVAARAMRQVLVRAAERRSAGKRGGGAVDLSLDDAVHAPLQAPAGSISAEQIIALDAAIERLEALDPRQARVVECRFFAGLSVDETAAALNVSAPTVKRDWRAARAWLARALDG
ncbi:MAG: sigma-70 family RNA polymerase sigma factor [Gemmatimonadetes bacterium]|nr:sigma-70 family RNA polymerase sigma factor [Gemmatimonadota bacterium]NNF38612.1 sigma-70 family RNA polymerase sigma factor [Gemmatimonadota bacterium]NNK62990.1 sigma-70 family RNA polymerase sigma factor [Gemmatimonadota bacterium]